MTSTRATATIHPETCMCPACLVADMNSHLETGGVDPARYGVEVVSEAERTRYATPGASCGNGTVRKASPAQVKFMKNLLATRDTTGLVRLPGAEDVDNISLRGARDLIDRLLACPVLPTVRPDAPSGKAVDFALSLADQKGVALVRADLEAKSRREVSQMIDMLKALPNTPSPVTTAAPEVTEGMYRNPETGDIFKIQRAVHGSGNLYAKILVVDQPWERDAAGTVITEGESHFDYTAGAIRKIRPEWRMTVDQAREFGALYGVCCRCSKTLTKEESIEAGIGPVCAGKF